MNNKTSSFHQRLNEAMILRDMKQVDLVRVSGLSKQKVNQYVSGQFEAKQDGVFILAKALNINEAWLMGYDVPMERTDHQKFDDASDPVQIAQDVSLIEQVQNRFGKDAVQLLHVFMELNDLGKEKALENLFDLAELPKYTDEDTMYRAARSKEHTAPQVIKKSKDRISKLEKAPKVTNSDDL